MYYIIIINKNISLHYFLESKIYLLNSDILWYLFIGLQYIFFNMESKFYIYFFGGDNTFSIISVLVNMRKNI